jgi:hypothetical protein
LDIGWKITETVEKINENLQRRRQHPVRLTDMVGQSHRA